MLDLKEIHEEIAKLEKGDTTYRNCEKLAILYIVREHYKPEVSDSQKAAATAKI